MSGEVNTISVNQREAENPSEAREAVPLPFLSYIYLILSFCLILSYPMKICNQTPEK
jgi:hypothetical protein